jgi:hypothetical protein
MNTPLSSLNIPDLQAGSHYISQLSLANPELAEQQILAFLDALIENPPDAGVLLSLLEQTRVPLCFTEEELARRYINKALVLSDEQEGSFLRVISAWRRMTTGYSLCARLHEPEPDNPHYSTLVATIQHRCLYYAGLIIIEHFRARRELPPGIWQELHGYYKAAEQRGVSCTPVNDSLESDLQATHCAAAYVTLLLIEIANPYGTSARDLALIRRWAGMWAPLVALHPVEDEYEIPPYVIDFTKDQPLHQTGSGDTIGGDSRWLDTTRLGLQISHMVSQLGLGEETSGHARRLLERLARPWTQSASPRRFRRFASHGTARVATGFEAIHFFVGGKEFVQPDSGSIYGRGQFDEVFTFRDRVAPGQALNIKPRVNYSADEWAVINHSANGFRLGRSNAGEKIAHSQLLAVCPHDGERFLLGQATWLMQEFSGGILAGVAILPGMPEAVTVRRASIRPGHADRFVRAFLLPPVEAIGQEGSLVLPTGIYQASGALELIGEGKSWTVRMKHVRQRGIDFERVSYEMP